MTSSPGMSRIGKRADQFACPLTPPCAPPSMRAGAIGAPYSALIPPRWITPVHFDTSSFIRCANSAGLLPTG